MFQIHDKLQVFFTIDIRLSDNKLRGSCQFIMSPFWPPVTACKALYSNHVRGSTQSGPAISSSHTPELPIWCDHRRSNPPLPTRDGSSLILPATSTAQS